LRELWRVQGDDTATGEPTTAFVDPAKHTGEDENDHEADGVHGGTPASAPTSKPAEDRGSASEPSPTETGSTTLWSPASTSTPSFTETGDTIFSVLVFVSRTSSATSSSRRRDHLQYLRRGCPQHWRHRFLVSSSWQSTTSSRPAFSNGGGRDLCLSQGLEGSRQQCQPAKLVQRLACFSWLDLDRCQKPSLARTARRRGRLGG
jgi:hypothetical protein